MKSSNAIAYSVVVLLLACSGSSGGGTTLLSPTVNLGNVLPVSVKSSLYDASSSANDPNRPCVCLTLCASPEAFYDSSSNKVFDDIEALANHHCDRALSSSVGGLPPVHSRGSVVPLGSSEIDRTANHIMAEMTIQPAGAWLLESSCALEWM